MKTRATITLKETSAKIINAPQRIGESCIDKNQIKFNEINE